MQFTRQRICIEHVGERVEVDIVIKVVLRISIIVIRPPGDKSCIECELPRNSPAVEGPVKIRCVVHSAYRGDSQRSAVLWLDKQLASNAYGNAWNALNPQRLGFLVGVLILVDVTEKKGNPGFL